MIIKLIKKYISSLLLDPIIVSPFTKDLSGYIIVITGGSRGIGKAIANLLMREGAQIIVLSRNGGDKQETIYPIKTDITDSKQINNAINNIVNKFGKIDVLINNAGQFLDKPIEDISEEEYDSLIDTNIKGTFLVTKAVVPCMKKMKSGLIINIGSKISHNTNVAPKKVLYATSKYAIEGFSFALNKELKPFGIRVTCLMPGTVNTFISRKAKKYMSPYHIGQIVLMMIKFKDIDFESIIFKSRHQNI